ncbi:rifin [Plasmodium reichenowi]|uniref:Rifin n=1 Tax=Plasmodium reichenowi TaxID=5854 RepID=A0A060RLV4_PLARE|nr:rifin [Plasmodium reichenowi]
MNVHYINILLFALPLNILVNTHKELFITPCHTPITRLLCECELYETANYDSDSQMKEVMENFNKQTQKRFQEYDERMKTTRQKCKDRCDKEIQKIILKDKLEKQMEQQLTTLETKITTEDIPTCVCEKSLADKTQKFCLNCGKNMGAIAPWWGLVCGAGYAGWLNAATAAAIEAAKKAGIEEGVKAVIAKIKYSFEVMLSNVEWSKYINGSNYSTVDGLVKAVTNAINSCEKAGTSAGKILHARQNLSSAGTKFGEYIAAGKDAAATETEIVEAAKLGEVATTSSNICSAIGYSVLAIVIIILIMVIIYLILRHRRKKKMKKKFQYIKLLEE